MARVIKSNFIETQNTYIIGYHDIKDENKASTKSIESLNKNGDAINKVFKEEVEKKVRVEKLEQLKLKLQNETEEIKKSANEFSDRIIETANVRAREIVESANEKIAELFQEKERQGYEKGFEEAMSKYDYMLKEAKNILDEAHNFRQESFANAEKQIINLTVECVKKIIRQRIKEDDEMVTNVVLSSIEELNARKKLTVRISRDDFEETSMLRTRILSMFPTVQDIEIKIVDSYRSGDIEIESDDGTVNASIEDQIIKLKEEFSKLFEVERKD